MLRSGILASLLLALALVNVASAQVVVTNGAYATTSPSVVSGEGAPTVPAINTPFAHVGPEGPPQSDQTQLAAAETTNTNNNASSGPVNLGVAETDNNDLANGGSDARPLGEIAREMKQQAQNANAKTFTNADIQKLGQSGTSNNTSVPNANGNDNWPANNGVVTPEPNNPQGVTAAPAQNPGATGMSPFAPKSQVQPETQTPPQANAKPSAERPYEMAQNNPANSGIPQLESQGSTNSDNSSATTLPKTASRLPLLGVLGFFSVSMGLFVRYQRAKEAK